MENIINYLIHNLTKLKKIIKVYICKVIKLENNYFYLEKELNDLKKQNADFKKEINNLNVDNINQKNNINILLKDIIIS